jgi:hypothetical protein
MISWLRSIQLTRKQVAFVAVLSGIGTGVIIASALGQTGAQQAILAAFGRRFIVHAVAPAASAPATSANSGAAPSASPAAPALTPAPATFTPAAASTSNQSDPSSAGTGNQNTDGSGQQSGKKSYPVKHVFVIALSTPSYAAAWGPHSAAHYLNETLRKRGTLLSGYQSLGASALPDDLAMVSGESPNPDTRADCATYAEFPTDVKVAKDDQVKGDGCVYPNTVLTVGDQVTASGSRWGAYVEDMGTAACLHPNSNAADDAPLPGAGPDYDTGHNPFIYFHSLLDLGDCSTDDQSLDKLPSALASASKTPTFAFIAPGACEDAVETTCASGDPAGIAGEDAFLKQWVPKITGSPAFKQDGELLIVFTPPGRALPASASAPAGTPTTTTPGTSTTPTTTTTATPGVTTPTTTTPTTTTPTTTTTSTPAADSVPTARASQAPGNGPLRMGALVISRYTKSGATIATSYSPYSLLRSVEDVFGFTPLAAAAGAKSFAAVTLTSG